MRILKTIALIGISVALAFSLVWASGDAGVALSQRSTTPSRMVTLSPTQPAIRTSNRPLQITSRVVKTAQPAPPEEGELVDTYDFKVRVRGNRPAIFVVDAENNELRLSDASKIRDMNNLSNSIRSALEIVNGIDPEWGNLFLSKMADMDAERADALAAMLNATDETDWRDEIAWVLSHHTTEDLANTNLPPEAIRDNARLIYEQAERLAYVSLVEKEDGKTTTLYRVSKDGAESNWELPVDMYYRMVVNMKMDWERPELIYPRSGRYRASPEGVFWRDYFSRTTEPPTQYTAHKIMMSPTDIHAAAMPEILFSSGQVLTAFDTLPLRILDAEETGDSVLAEIIKRGGQRGAILATTLPVEQLADEGTPELLENMLVYDTGLFFWFTSRPMVIIQDRDPFGLNVIEQILTDRGFDYSIVSSAEFTTMELDPETKYIIPSDQPRALYEALASRTEDVDAFLNSGGLLQLHLNTEDPSDSPDGIIFPLGFTTTTLASKQTHTITESGFSNLPMAMDGIQIAWDGVQYNGLSGNRPHDPTSFAIDMLGWWGSDNLIYSIAQWGESHLGAERAVQPARIAYNHYGNCGEIQDILTSGGRTALLPIINAHNSAEDHVWSMLYVNDEWIPFQFDWSDGPTRIRNFGISYEKLWGGGKDCSCIVVSEGDGTIWSAIDMFSDKVDFSVRVTDASGRPVDGAWVMIATEAWQSESLTIGSWGATNDAGEFTTTLGDLANYYLRIETPNESIPPEDNTVALAIADTDAQPDEVFSFEHTLSTSLHDEWRVGDKEGELPAMTVSTTVTADWAAIASSNAYTGDTTLLDSELPDATWIVLSPEQLAAYNNTLSRSATRLVSGNDVQLDLAKADKWYLMLVPHAFSKEAVFSGSLNLYRHIVDPVDGDNDDDNDDDADFSEEDISEEDLSEIDEPIADGDENVEPDGDDKPDGDFDSTEEDSDSGNIYEDSGSGGGCASTSNHNDSYALLTVLLFIFIRKFRIVHIRK